MSRARVIVALSMFLSVVAAGTCFADDNSAFLQVIVTRQEHDPFLPWQKGQPIERYGYGAVVGPGLVLTTERLVRNHNLVELRAARSGERIPAVVKISDDQVNLALIKVTADHGLPPFKAMEIAGAVSEESELEILQLDSTRQVQRGDAQLLRVAMKSLPSASYASLTFDLLTDLNVTGEGAPAILNGKLAGLVMSYTRERRVGNMIPFCVIRQFLDDASTSPYRGFASAGFLWKQLIDPARREWLGVGDQDGGILVLSAVSESGAADVLEPNDVILEWDDRKIDSLGFYDDKEFGRLSLPYLIKGRRRPGEAVPVKIIRKGKQVSVQVKLTRADEKTHLIPDNTVGRKAEYVVEGGMIIREVTGRYLRSHGSDWQRIIDSSLVHTYHTKKLFPDSPGQRVVLLSAVLPHPVNSGYQQFRNRVITHLNGKPVSNMDDVFRIQTDDGNINRFTLKSMGIDLVLDKSLLNEANKNLSYLYRIPQLRWKRPPESQKQQ
ncbi:MAG: hypothetical protein QGI24_08145 [Kiritimatiellia bacterium]|jgi:hypothetical protein|nr:hypothetical protein [Kiritimatiellia bacterium]MDP6848744.1 hypothetical protein [Kiritimatiellia bacterium]